MAAADRTGAPDGESVVVAVLTYRRNEDLTQLLPDLRRQATENGADVMVVDNDPAGSARSVAGQLPGVRYVHEPRPGIAAARNAALAAAADDDLLVFIDDDERPVEGWLHRLLEVHRQRRPAAVVGPVVSTFESEPSAWVRAGHFFDRRRLPTGTTVDVAATNNLLLDLGQVRALDLTFDERFGISGGSDTLFTRALHRLGGSLVWCDEALVVDVVPTARTTARWVMLRALRSGNCWTRTSVTLARGRAQRVRVRAAMALQGLYRLTAGAARWLVGAVARDLGHRARGARTMARGAGMLSGTWGYVYSEYRRPTRIG
jgi:succinoglycan biosynthesis protein ExoM